MSSLTQELKKIDNLTPLEKKWFDLICINQGDGVPRKVGQSLIDRGLVVKTFGGYDVASYWTHYAWCQHCARQSVDKGDE